MQLEVTGTDTGRGTIVRYAEPTNNLNRNYISFDTLSFLSLSLSFFLITIFPLICFPFVHVVNTLNRMSNCRWICKLLFIGNLLEFLFIMNVEGMTLSWNLNDFS